MRCQGCGLIIANDAPRLRLCESFAAIPTDKRGRLSRVVPWAITRHTRTQQRPEGGWRDEPNWSLSLGRREYTNVFATML